MNFRSPSARTAIFYATFYSTPAVSNPFLAIWLSDKGLSSTQIGFVNALPVFLMILLNVAVGRVADHAKDWRSVIVAGAVIAARIASLVSRSSALRPPSSTTRQPRAAAWSATAA